MGKLVEIFDLVNLNQLLDRRILFLCYFFEVVKDPFDMVVESFEYLANDLGLKVVEPDEC